MEMTNDDMMDDETVKMNDEMVMKKGYVDMMGQFAHMNPS